MCRCLLLSSVIPCYLLMPFKDTNAAKQLFIKYILGQIEAS
jgi:hypothetical protein